MHVEVPERIPKVEVLRRKPDIMELPTVVTSELVIEPYVEDKIVNSLLKETSIEGDAALKIAQDVRHFLLENKIREISASMVREICVTLLLKRGLKNIAEQYCRVGLPITDVAQLIKEHTRENANLVHNPESIPPDEIVVVRERGSLKITEIGPLIDNIIDNASSSKIIQNGNSDIVREGFKLSVFSFDKELRMHEYPVSGVVRNNKRREIYQIELETGRKVTVTSDHNLFTLHNNSIVAVPTSQLKEGDFIAVPRFIRKTIVKKELNLLGELLKKCRPDDISGFYLRGNLTPKVLNRYRNRVESWCRIHSKTRPSTIISHWKKLKAMPVKLVLELGIPLDYEDLRTATIGTRGSWRTKQFPVIIELRPDVGKVFGYLLSEGTLTRDKVHFSNSSLELHEEFRSAYERAFKIPLPKPCKREGAYVTVVGGCSVALLFENAFDIDLTRAKGKRIPSFLFDSSEETIAAFLSSYLRGDGSIRIGNVRYSTTSRGMALGLIFMLLSQGIYPNVYELSESEFEIDIQGKENLEQFSTLTKLHVPTTTQTTRDIIPVRLPIYAYNGGRLKRGDIKSAANLLHIPEAIAYDDLSCLRAGKFVRRERLRRISKILDILDDQHSEKIQGLINSDLRWLRIETIKKVGIVNHTYDFEVRPDNQEIENFIGGFGFVCLHNTIHKLLADAVVREYTLTHILPRHLAKAHLQGLIHIHKLDYFPIRPYCASADIRYFLRYGVISDGVGTHVAVAKPAKHAEVAILHIAKAYSALQLHHSGAVGTDLFNVFLAPYVQGLPYNRIKQLMQMFIFEMASMPASRGGQVVFSDVNFEFGIPQVLKDIPAVLPGGVMREGVTYGDFEEEAQRIFRAAMEVYLEGDGAGKPFIFPKACIKLRREFIDKGEYDDLLLLAHKVSSKFGTPYFLNLLPEYMPDVVLAQCCRVLVKMRKEDYDELVEGRLRGGQFCNNTINLPRIAYEARDEGKIYELLRERMGLLKEVTFIHRGEIETRLKEGSLPFLSMTLDGQPYYRMDKVYHSIGMVGLNDMVQYITGRQLHQSKDAWALGLRVIQEMNNIVKDFEKDTGLRWVLSQTPAETTATRFAVIDLRSEFADEAKKVVKGDLERGAVYYSNSTHVNWEAKVPLIDKVQIEASFHPLLDGGLITPLYLGEHPDPSALMELTKRIAKNTLCAYWCYSLDFTQCRRCGYITIGIEDKCPNCGATEADLEWYAKVVNYYGRVKDWHLAKQVELRRRHRYKGAWGWS